MFSPYFKRRFVLLYLLIRIATNAYAKSTTADQPLPPVVSFYDPRIELKDGDDTSGFRQAQEQQQQQHQQDTKQQQQQQQQDPSTNKIHPESSFLTREFHPLSKPHGIDRTTVLDPTQYTTLKSSSTSGKSHSHYLLGLTNLYGLPPLTEPNEITASTYFRRAAVLGHSDAQCALGLLLYKGYGGIGRDAKSGTAWFKKSAEQGNARGLWLLGRAYYEGMVAPEQIDNRLYDSEKGTASAIAFQPDHEEAARLFELAIEKGIPEAAHHLALQYEYGLISGNGETSPLDPSNSRPHVPDFKKAAQLYTKAFDDGHVDSGYHLALMIAYGRGNTIDQNFNKALELFRQCATVHSHVPSIRYLGIFAASGHGEKNGVANYKTAVTWFDICARSEDEQVSSLCVGERDDLLMKIRLAKEHVLKISEQYEDAEVDFDFDPWTQEK